MENKNYFDYKADIVSCPGETLNELLEDRGITQAEFAQRTGRPKKTINEIIKGKAMITPVTAIQFERVLGVSASFWNQREYNYRQNLAERAEREMLKAQVDWVNQFPIKDMIQMGWIKNETDPVNLLEQVLRFFGIASPTQWQAQWGMKYDFRKSMVYEGDPFIVETWLRKGEITANAIQCEPYDEKTFIGNLQTIKELTTTGPEVFQAEVIRLCAEAGVAVAFVPEMPKLRVSGATRWLTPNKAMIQVNLRYKTDDQLWFTFYHEAGHILKHGKREVFIEDGEENEKEKVADFFAANFLIPQDEYELFVQHTNRFSKEAIREFAAGIKIAPGIVVGRLQYDGYLPINFCNDLKRPLSWGV